LFEGTVMKVLSKQAALCLVSTVILTFSESYATLRAQEYGTVPGAIPNPGTYQGSMQLQQQEQQQYQQQEQQNQQMLQRLDQNYRQYAPPQSGGEGRATGGPPPIDWWSKPALPPARNPLLGRWKQVAARAVTGQQIGSPLGGLLPGVNDFSASVLNGALAGGCKSIFGTGVVAFEPDKLQWVAPDGHEEILNNVAYRANGSEVIVLSRDPGAIPALIFGFPNHDHAVVAFFNCSMERVSAVRPTQPAPNASASPTPSPRVSPLGPAGSPPSRPANAMLTFQVGITDRGSFTPLPNIRILVLPENPDDVLVRAGYVPAGGSLAEKFSADCRNVQNCARDLQLMTMKALGVVRTDPAGHAQTPNIVAGRYYLFAIAPYQNKRLIWSQAVNLQTGSNSMNLDQTNGTLAQP
jgi:hypothetical protein